MLVAGASGGLGQALVAELAGRRAQLTLVARDPARLELLGPSGVCISADITDPGDCARAVEEAVHHHGRLDGLINTAGVVAFGPLAELDDDVAATVLAANLLGPLRLIRAAAPHLSRPSFIVNVSAVVASTPNAGMGLYSASKAALTAATLALAKELRREQVLVVDVQPPHMDTGLAERPVAGEAPALPEGHATDAVARRIVRAVLDGERTLAADAFSPA